MAANDLTANAAERMDIALQATRQIHGLFEGLVAQAAPLFDQPEHLQQAAVIRALTIREARLNDAMLSMLGDALGSVPDARRVVSEGRPSSDEEEMAYETAPATE